ncbi:MAG: Hsp20/alpha crystallin family protein [Bacteroidota bacterium]
MFITNNKAAKASTARNRFLTVNDLIRDLMDEASKPQTSSLNSPKVNIYDTVKDIRLEFVVPGFNKDDFKITVEDGVLNVRAEYKSEVNDSEQNCTRREYSFRSFSRSFTLPDTVNADAVAASYQNGILMVTLPKKEESKPAEPRRISVN